jgi:hypothetical protein
VTPREHAYSELPILAADGAAIGTEIGVLMAERSSILLAIVMSWCTANAGAQTNVQSADLLIVHGKFTRQMAVHFGKP